MSSYQRVPCHLQDPLKGAALVYSLVFYFFFCRKGGCQFNYFISLIQSSICPVGKILDYCVLLILCAVFKQKQQQQKLCSFSLSSVSIYPFRRFTSPVMGLQRLFSATTAVVGLFISVDYGLCDEFRCRGSSIAAATTPSVGWQGRAMWTLVYVAGIALWTLHLSLLEGNVVTPVNVN